MKIKLGFPIDPKTFNPLRLTLNGKRIIKSNLTAGSINPMELLESLTLSNRDDESRESGIKVLKTIYDKVNPL